MASSYPSPSGRHRSRAGFTLLELAVVVTILGVISAIALPAYQRIQRNTRFGALINDYRVLTSAFQQYSAVNASWPAYAGTPGAFPQGMEEYLRTTNWSQATVFGGHYNWEQDVTHAGRKVKAAIAIYAAPDRPLTMTAAEMQLFDERYDDGDLATGYFQKGYLDCPLYIIEDDPLYATGATAPVVDEAGLEDIANLPDPEQAAADVARAAAEKAAQEAAEQAAAEQAAKDAAEQAAAEKTARDAAEKAVAEEVAKAAAQKAAEEKAAQEAAAKAAAEQAARAAAEKAAAEQAARAAAEQAAKEAAEQAAAEQAARDAAEEAARNTPVALATTHYDRLVAQAAQLSVKVPNSLTNALDKFTRAAETLASTDPTDPKLLAKNTKAYESAEKSLEKALESFEKTLDRAEDKK